MNVLFDAPTTPWDISYGEVREGGGLNVVIDQEDVKVFEIDFNTKYAEAGGEVYGEDHVAVLFVSGERTLRSDEEKKLQPTVLRLKGKWTVLARCSRYTAYVCVYRRDTDG